MSQCVSWKWNAVERSVDTRGQAALAGNRFCRDETARRDRDPFVMERGGTLGCSFNGLLHFLHSRGRVDVVRPHVSHIVLELSHRLLLLSCNCLSGVCLAACIGGRRLGLLNCLISLPKLILQLLDLLLLLRQGGLLRRDRIFQRLNIGRRDCSRLFFLVDFGAVLVCATSAVASITTAHNVQADFILLSFFRLTE